MGKEVLGEKLGTAQNKLKKIVLFSLIQKCGLDSCYRCSQLIENVDQLSIEHKIAWQGSPDPHFYFYNLDNISFSHLRCNIAASDKTWRLKREKCRNGHLYSEYGKLDKQGVRRCSECNRENTRRWREQNKDKYIKYNFEYNRTPERMALQRSRYIKKPS